MRIYFGFQVDQIISAKDNQIDLLQVQVDKLEAKLKEKEDSLALAVDHLLHNAGQATVIAPKPRPESDDEKNKKELFSMIESVGGDTNDPEEASELRSQNRG